MKRYLIFMASALLLWTGCQQEEIPAADDAVGYLSIGDLSVEVGQVERVATRAVSEELYLRIAGEGQTLVYEPGKVPAEIELKAGNYTVQAYNVESYQAGQPLYSKDTSIVISEGVVNHISLRVPLRNVGVRLKLPEAFADRFPAYTFTVRQGDDSHTLKDAESYYFESVSGGEIGYSIEVTNADGEKKTDSGTLSAAVDGTLYLVSYDYATKSLRLEEP